MDGLDLFGAEPVATEQGGYMTNLKNQFSQGLDTAAALATQTNARLKAMTAPLPDPEFERKKKRMLYTVGGSMVGAIVGGGAGLLWKSHRVAGTLLGLLLLGPAAGAGAGYLIGGRK